MSVLARVKSWFGFGGGHTIPDDEATSLAVQQAPRRTPPPSDGAALLRLVMSTPEFTRVALRVAESFSGIEFYAVEGNGANARGLVDVLERPNSHLSGRAVRYLEQLYFDTLGESFAVVSIEGRRVSYLPVPPTWVQVETGAEQPYIITLGSQQYRFGPDEVVWYKRPNPVDPYGRGLGLGRAAADEVETIEYAAKHAKSYFYNDATPPLIFSANGLQAADAKRAKEAYEAKHRGFSKAHKAAFISGDWKVHRLGDSAPASGVTDLRQYLADVVRSLYSVPPEVIGQLDSSNKATITAALEIFARMCLEPRALYYVDEVNAKLVPLLERLGVSRGVTLGFVSTIPEDVEAKREVMKTHPWAFTVNEVRGVIGYAPRAGGDVYIRQADRLEEVAAGAVEEERSAGPVGPPPFPARAGHELALKIAVPASPNVINIREARS